VKRPINIGHRGHELKPENTLESFLEAIECGAEMLELDVWLTGDGVPVVYHDEFLVFRGGKGERIAQHTVDTLQKLELPGGVKIPTLESIMTELLPLVPLNIELKFFDLNYRPFVGAVVDLIRKLKAERKVLVSSFFHQSLEIVNRAEPKIATAPIFGRPTGPPHEHDLEKLASLGGWRSRIGFYRPAAVVDYLMLDKKVLREFQRCKLALVAYTVNEPEEMRTMVNLGVTGIITKRPAVLRKLLRNV
jgi:glycerophosphoryl diester phosphodiesterase